MAEFDLIARIRERSRHAGIDDGVVLGIGDDAALLQVPAGHELVVTADTLNDGVHFPHATAPADVGWKALAVNLSDLAAMGARPAWCTLSLSLPGDDPAWLDAFLDGFLELASIHRIALVGGDTTRGPRSIAVTALGVVEAGRALRRDHARVGDDIWVTGTLGDAAAALALGGHLPWPEAAGGGVPGADAGNTADPAGSAFLAERLARPRPGVAAGRQLPGLAHACVDISDGLLADLGHVCACSGTGAQVDVDALPASVALRTLLEPRASCASPPLAAARRECMRAFQATGGDDYELCFTASPSRRDAVAAALGGIGVDATRIGRIVATPGVHALTADAAPWQAPHRGYVHFG
ncbi:thiamine-phosphate kinase [Pseudoxanthomonas koreensis]|uniref:thiamine-phosphate kinase n=1 Tax=Pseudoxanthomonas koreensis TaxID=266061 RepID=UPI0035A63330